MIDFLDKYLDALVRLDKVLWLASEEESWAPRKVQKVAAKALEAAAQGDLGPLDNVLAEHWDAESESLWEGVSVYCAEDTDPRNWLREHCGTGTPREIARCLRKEAARLRRYGGPGDNSPLWSLDRGGWLISLFDGLDAKIYLRHVKHLNWIVEEEEADEFVMEQLGYMGLWD